MLPINTKVVTTDSFAPPGKNTGSLFRIPSHSKTKYSTLQWNKITQINFTCYIEATVIGNCWKNSQRKSKLLWYMFYPLCLQFRHSGKMSQMTCWRVRVTAVRGIGCPSTVHFRSRYHRNRKIKAATVTPSLQKVDQGRNLYFSILQVAQLPHNKSTLLGNHGSWPMLLLFFKHHLHLWTSSC